MFLFIDGVGLTEPKYDNPLNAEVCPAFFNLIRNHGKPIDACLGVSGAPQSATGQATMFTGVNCAKELGRHCEGFPPPAVKRIVNAGNIFLELKKRGRKVSFADAYLVDSIEELESERFLSVTSVMALTVPESIRILPNLINDDAVMQDITRETIQDNFPDVPIVSPVRAARHLFNIASSNDFTLYEFFQSDVAGHSMDYARACAVLRLYDRFLAQLITYTEAAGITLVMTSDHGNVESIDSRSHTLNPVPFIAYGPKEKFLRERVNSLTDVTPAILEAFDSSQKPKTINPIINIKELIHGM